MKKKGRLGTRIFWIAEVCHGYDESGLWKTGQPILSVLPSGEKYGVGLFGGRRYLYRGAGAVQPLSELDQDAAGGAVSITLILAAALLTGLGWFDKLAKRAGAGTLVPITGFANAMVSPALEFKSEGLITGTAAKLFVVAGPVLVFGISASVLYGLILCIFRG